MHWFCLENVIMELKKKTILNYKFATKSAKHGKMIKHCVKMKMNECKFFCSNVCVYIYVCVCVVNVFCVVYFRRTFFYQYFFYLVFILFNYNIYYYFVFISSLHFFFLWDIMFFFRIVCDSKNTISLRSLTMKLIYLSL